MKKIFLIIALALNFISNAQSFTEGVFNTTFGTINLTFEQGIEYPNGGMVYGDYKGIGTITGATTNAGKELVGSFHNGAAEGKFIFFSPYGKQDFFDRGITSFTGNWGYSTDNKYSTNPDYIWKVTSKVGGKDAIKNVTNVWSGKWNTNHGYLILQQVGNKVSGKYKDVGNINATYNSSTQKLTGTFTNGGKTGYIEFNFEGNSFNGKWGWSTAMTEGKWEGTKHLKTNKEVISVDYITKVIGEWDFGSALNGQKICNKIKVVNKGTLSDPKFAVIVINPTQSFLDFSGYNSFTSSEFNLSIEKKSNTIIPGFLFYEIGQSIEINNKVTRSYLTLIPQFNQNNQLISFGVSLNQRVYDKKTKVENSVPVHINNFIK